MNDDTSGSNTPPELVEDSTSRDVSSTYETTLPRASRDLKKDLGQDNLGNAELSNVPMPGDYMESADDGSFGTHSSDNDITFSSLFRKPPTYNVATEKFATIGDKDLRGDTTPSTAEVGSSDNSKEVQIMSKSHLATINSQPLTQSADKQVLFARLGLNEQVHKLLVQDAQMARDRLSADASNLTDQSRLSPYITAPYRWDEISETAKHRILSEVVGNASPDVKHYYTLGSYRTVVNEENWVARWYLWHSFRYRDNREPRQRAKVTGLAKIIGDTNKPSTSGRKYWNPARDESQSK
ncbi:hypothetical protein HBI25_143830 [Parastagonospora nodorum]|nr:hypothetical protein HBH51_074310 [Parastagonospora nodorum]KAH3982358.1 hypothetical protein HBH52_080170 [Parastagonospora nodorum]KAH4007258.1 hypothetical protein HBI10_002180 [Parastagonospora nodorum]KAH4016586.1 hypothetical protein HBI13_150190 [Parastagonospora nodorum]KAH4040824.1 hypothetical protein HBI09_014380 [Parastagonospora nodorum]